MASPVTSTPTRRAAFAVASGIAGAALAARIVAAQQPASAASPVRLFKAVAGNSEVTFGMTSAELDRLGTGPEVERIARRLVAEGQITVWRYVVARAPDGTTRHAASSRIALLRNDTLRIEPYAPALPVVPPPAE